MENLLGTPFRRWIEAHEEELISFRRHLHAHPEPSGEEHETTDFIKDRLEVAGLEPRVLATGTGLVCDIGGGNGPMTALRGDIDALRMDDEKDVSYRSRNPGVAHACGHDVHTAIVLGTGIYFADLGDRFKGRVRLIFEPSEERLPGGALDVIADGGLKDVDAILGVHCDPKLDVGKIGLREGSITSAADMAEIVLSGPGGHTARPEDTVDMIQLVASIVKQLPDQVADELGARGLFKLVFGAIHSGDAANVIPTHATIKCSIRTPSPEIWQALGGAFDRATSTVIAGTGAEASTRYVHGVPPVVNDATITNLVRRAAERELSEKAITAAAQSWGGDDFAWYVREVPGSFVRVGTHDPDSGSNPSDLHVGDFDVDERAIAVGVRLLAAAVSLRAAEAAGQPETLPIPGP